MDRETFAASVQSRQDALFRVAFSILQNREDALVQPLDVEIEFALLRAVSEGDAPDLEAFATLSKNITVAVTLATLDLAPDALCLHVEGDSDAAKAFNEKMTFPTKQEGR